MMSDISRRDAVKLTAAGLAAGTGVLLAKETHGQEPRRFATAEERWKGHRLANPKELERHTKPIPIRIGVEPPGNKPLVVDAQLLREHALAFAPLGVQPLNHHWGAPRPDLNGLRVQLPGHPEIYLIDAGYRRWIPDAATYNNLFRDWNGVAVDIDLNEIPIGTPITSGATLARAYGTPAVYLLDQNVRRWIVSAAMMDKYYFAWDRVHELPAVVINSIRTGHNLDS
jgi:hypothetical protein